jgi:hypothetical protein
MANTSPTATRRAPKRIALGAVALLIATTIQGPAQAAAVHPRLVLIEPSSSVKLFSYGRNPRVPLDLGVLVGSLDAPFELQAHRPDYTHPLTLSQVLHDGDGSTELLPLDVGLLDEWNGLNDFFDVTFLNDAGETVLTKSVTFCPSGYDRQRIDDSGPARSNYPSGCFGNPFIKGMVWGIDQGWAISALSYENANVRIAEGQYHAVVRIAQPYVDLFDIDSTDATAEVDVTVKRARNGCGKGCCPKGCGYAESDTTDTRNARPRTAAADPITPDPSILPDLIPLPSWGITIENRRERSYIDFGATVWNGGATDLVVEGFRRAGEPLMDAYQYFYSGDTLMGKERVGDLEYDPRRGHQHWHFKQFAAYSLVDPGGDEVRLSRKEAFCLAPTDALDLTLPGVNMDPALGLTTACGSQNSIWTRETLPLGWGDTYFQGLPGQSFNITKVPNGSYYIKVEANPSHLLYEQRTDNNIEYREVILSGEAGNRQVEVPPWNGIDTEADNRGGGGGRPPVD